MSLDRQELCLQISAILSVYSFLFSVNRARILTSAPILEILAVQLLFWV